ncbi:MAG TPA: helix-turn-helix transcriptional regulator, partial [Candidatus Jeotgalibaca merdavium]|nr:helix-turn-helix transcriptional regulator [Candidatus Jeotgalibaca merdavium]
IHDLLNQLMIQKFELDFEDTEIPAYIKDVKLFLDEALSQHLSLEDLEARFHINKYQIAKDFSKYIGTPPIDYQLNQKISHAKDLLRYSKLTIQEISLEIGIENFAYFSRLFKKRTGLTPSLYRKNG